MNCTQGPGSDEQSFPQLDLTGKLIIKAQLGDDIRRIPIHNDAITYDELVLMMQRVFRGQLNSTDDITIKYKDEDGDLITIFDSSDLVFAVQYSRILKLTILVGGETASRNFDSVQLRHVQKELQFIRDRVVTLIDSLAHSGSTSSRPSSIANHRTESTPPRRAVSPREFDPLQDQNQSSHVPGVSEGHVNGGPTAKEENHDASANEVVRSGSPDSISSSGSRKVVQQQPSQPPAQPQGVVPASTPVAPTSTPYSHQHSYGDGYQQQPQHQQQQHQQQPPQQLQQQQQPPQQPTYPQASEPGPTPASYQGFQPVQPAASIYQDKGIYPRGPQPQMMAPAPTPPQQQQQPQPPQQPPNQYGAQYPGYPVQGYMAPVPQKTPTASSPYRLPAQLPQGYSDYPPAPAMQQGPQPPQGAAMMNPRYPQNPAAAPPGPPAGAGGNPYSKVATPMVYGRPPQGYQ